MNNGNSVNAVKRAGQERLAPVCGVREASWIMRAIFEHVMGWDATALVLHSDYELNDYTVERIGSMVDRVVSGEPVQYVTGTAPFYGMNFSVKPGVLIPRPETAELVDIIVTDWRGRDDLRVLDCGTGSGCIAIALARNLPFASVTAIDKSDVAVEVASDNARSLKVKVNVKKADMLALDDTDEGCYDIIVSNPPYIAERERAGMEANVLDYEPAAALFVPDDDPLLFYRAVSRYAVHALAHGGKLYFEINPLFVNEMKAILSGMFANVDFVRDSQGAMRFATAVKL